MAGRAKTKAFLLPEELWWGSWICAGVGALLAGVLANRSGPTVDFGTANFSRHAVPAAQAFLGALAAAAPALTLSLLRREGRIRFEYGARPPRYHGLAVHAHPAVAPLRRPEPRFPAPGGEVRDYHVLAAAGAVLLCLAPAMPFVMEFTSGTWTGAPGLAAALAGAALWATAAVRFLRRLNADG